MIEKLSAVENRFEQIGIELTRPETINDTATFTFNIFQEDNTITVKADVSTPKQKNTAKFKLLLQYA